MKKLKPILFSTPMVQAILEGRKTMTRRIIKPQPVSISADGTPYEFVTVKTLCNNMIEYHSTKEKGPCVNLIKPKYQPGDILWVRESWRIRHWDFEDGEYTVEYKDGAKQICELREDADEWLLKTWEKALSKGYLEPSKDDEESVVFTDKKQPFSPSIHMPFEAARIFLEVTNVSAERLQDISEEDAIAEGAKDHLSVNEMKDMKDLDWIIKTPFYMHQFGFLSLWCQLNGTKSWEANPWVWVYEFKRVEKQQSIK